MEPAKFRSNKTSVSPYVILMLSMLVLLTVPASAMTQDGNAIATLRAIGKTFAGIAEKASLAVVVLTIDKPIISVRPETDPWWKIDSGSGRSAPNPEPSDKPRSTHPAQPYSRPSSSRIQKLGKKAKGLGFVLSNDGHILTCNHLVDNAQKFNAKLADGRQFEAEIVGTDPDTDIAVLKIDANNLSALELDDSNELEVGDWVVGIGNTMGIGRTFATGLVTAKGRNLGMAVLEDLMQTTIDLQIGDGGGPLLDLDGNVVGINIAIMGERGMGISFAIPADMAKEIYEQLIKTGTVERGFLGVGFKEVDAEIAEDLDLEATKGIVVQNVIKDSAAETAGIKKYDVLVEFNNEPVESASGLLMSVAVLKPGTHVVLVILRDGQRQNLTVTLGKRPSAQELTADDAPNTP